MSRSRAAIAVVLVLASAAPASAQRAQSSDVFDEIGNTLCDVGKVLPTPGAACQIKKKAEQIGEKGPQALIPEACGNKVPGVGCVIKKGEKIIDDPADAAKDVLTAPIKAASDGVMSGVTSWVADGAKWAVKATLKAIDETSTVRLDGKWFRTQYALLVGLAAALALPFLLAAVIQALLHFDWALLARAVLLRLPLAFLLTAGAIVVTRALLDISDQMSIGVTSTLGGNAEDFLSKVGDAISAGMVLGNNLPLFATFFGALIVVIGAFVVWLELLFRAAAIYVAVLFLPMTFMAMVWPATARWAKRLVEILVAFIFSKFLIVAIMSLAAAGLSQSGSGDAFSGMLAGAVLLILAAFSPMVLLRLIPAAEAHAASGFHRGAGPQPIRGQAMNPASPSRQALGALRGGGAGGGGSGPSAAGGGAGKGPGASGGGGAAGAGGGAAAGAAGAMLAGVGMAKTGGDAVRGRGEQATQQLAGQGGGVSGGGLENTARAPSQGSGGGPPPPPSSSPASAPSSPPGAAPAPRAPQREGGPKPPPPPQPRPPSGDGGAAPERPGPPRP